MPSPSPTSSSPTFRAVVYARVSTTEQAKEEKASIPAQIQAGRETASQHSWALTGEPYVDAGVSGQKYEEREGLQRMLHDADQGRFDLLLIYDNDRLSRKGLVGALVYDRLDRAGVQVYSIHQPIEPRPPKEYDPQEDDTGLINRSIGSLSSELYLRGFRRRSRLGMERRVRAGYMPKSVPYGYQIEYRRNAAGTPEKLRVPHPQQAPFVQRIFAEYRNGQSLLAIARTLNAEGVPTQTGSVWCSQTLRGILMNPVYSGEIVYGKVRSRHGKIVPQDESQWLRVPGKHQPLISREVFAEVQRIRCSRARCGRAVGSKRLLSGLAKCGYCGWSMVKEGSWGGGYYVCGQYHQSGQCQRNGKYLVRKLETLVLGELRRLQQDPQLLEKLRQKQQRSHLRDVEREWTAQRQRQEEFPARRERLLLAYERGVLTVEELEERKLALAEEEQHLHHSLRQLEQQRAHQQQQQQAGQAAQEAWRTFDAHFQALPLPLQKQLLRNLIEKIVLHQQDVRIHYRLT